MGCCGPLTPVASSLESSTISQGTAFLAWNGRQSCMESLFWPGVVDSLVRNCLPALGSSRVSRGIAVLAGVIDSFARNHSLVWDHRHLARNHCSALESLTVSHGIAGLAWNHRQSRTPSLLRSGRRTSGSKVGGIGGSLWITCKSPVNGHSVTIYNQ